MKKFKLAPQMTSSSEFLFGDSQSRGQESLYLGRLAEIGPTRKVYFDLSGEHVVAIVGKRGTGKSYSLGSILESLCTKQNKTSIGLISCTRAALLFDTLNIYWTTVYSLSSDSPRKIIRDQSRTLRGWDIQTEELDVQLWVPAGQRTEGMPAQFHDFFIDTSDFSAADWGALLNVDILQDRMGQLLNDTFEKVTNEGWGSRPAKARYSIDDLLECIANDQEIQRSYHSETIRAVTQQLKFYSRNPVFSSNGTKLTEMLVPGRLSIILTASLAEELRSVLVAVVIRKILTARAEASFDRKRVESDPTLTPEEEKHLESKLKEAVPRTWVAVDEAQNVIPSDRRTTCLGALVRLVKEGRNFGLSFVFTTQQPSAINEQIMSQVDTMMVHKLAVQRDIEEVRRNLKSGEPVEVKYGNQPLSLPELVRALELGQALVSNTEVERYFVVDVRPRITVHGGFEA